MTISCKSPDFFDLRQLFPFPAVSTKKAAGFFHPAAFSMVLLTLKSLHGTLRPVKLPAATLQAWNA
jgi:hypothetical protein